MMSSWRRIRAEYELRELLAWKVHLGQHGVATVGARARGVSSGACASLDREGIEYDRVWPLATRYGRSDRNVPELEVASFDGRVRRGGGSRQHDGARVRSGVV